MRSIKTLVQKTVLVGGFFSMILSVSSQENREFRSFGTQEYHEQLKETEGYLKNRSQFEKVVNEKRGEAIGGEINLQLVFHILHSDLKGFVSAEQIMSQVEALNEHFSQSKYKPQHPADTIEGFNKLVTDSGIRFCVAGEERVGINTPMVYYYPGAATAFQLDNTMKESLEGGATAILPDQYINIWVCDMEGTSAGYAQLPGGPTSSDGIVIDYEYFGSDRALKSEYNEGKTLTHLMGSYLNLIEIWGETRCSDDRVYDTPVHNAPNKGCPGYRHVSTCHDNPTEMTMNYMDNTDDACMYMFTKGQVERMRAALSENGGRGGLVATSPICTKDVFLADNIELRSLYEQNTLVSIIPNPANESIHILVRNKQASLKSLQVLDVTGREIFYQNGIQTNEMKITTRNWPAGMYSVKISGASSQQAPIVKKIMIIH